MKNTVLYFFLMSVAISFGQVSQNPISESDSPIKELLHTKKSLYDLNLSFFELYGNSTKGSTLLNKLSDGINAKGLRYPFHFPVFILDGDFIQKMNSLETKRKAKMDIYDVIEPKYYLRTVG